MRAKGLDPGQFRDPEEDIGHRDLRLDLPPEGAKGKETEESAAASRVGQSSSGAGKPSVTLQKGTREVAAVVMEDKDTPSSTPLPPPLGVPIVTHSKSHKEGIYTYVHIYAHLYMCVPIYTVVTYVYCMCLCSHMHVHVYVHMYIYNVIIVYHRNCVSFTCSEVSLR